jgi:tRNA G26 N,N-dimethylase Trm1
MDYLFLFSTKIKNLRVKYIGKGQEKGGMRKLCSKCNKRPVAINYYKNSKPYYRSKCDHCTRGYREDQPLWALAAYKKKNICDRCGAKSQHSEVFNVFHVDGNLTNCRHNNLKTVCANCQRILHKEGIKWKQGGLTADF